MSLPEFPTTQTDLTRDDAINQIISSIAMEELALSHIINAEGEKLQYVLGTIPGVTGPGATIEQVLEVNESVRSVLQAATENQAALRAKLQNALSASILSGPTGATGATGATGPTGLANGLNAFGGIYNNLITSTNLLADEPFAVQMPFTVASRNVSYTPANSITVEEAGAYYIIYSMYPTFNAPANLIFEVRSNGTAIVPTLSDITVAASNYSVNYAGNTIAELPAGAIIDIAVTSSANQTMSFTENSLETLNLFKMD